MRPPRADIYNSIMSGTADQIIRKKYCFATTWPFDQKIVETPGGIIWIDCGSRDQTTSFIAISPLLQEDFYVRSAQDPDEFCIINNVFWSKKHQLPSGAWICLPEITMDWYYMD